MTDHDGLGSYPLVWKMAGGVAATLAGVAARRALSHTWTVVADEPPPRNVARSGVRWRDALVWAVTSAAVVSAARLLARGAAGEIERRTTGEVTDTW